MASNQQELSDIYRQISVMELIQKLEGCGVTWNQIGVGQYKVLVDDEGDIWEMFLTRMPSFSNIVLDVRRNGQHFYSVDSTVEASLIVMFNEIEGDAEFDKDRALMQDVQGFSDCS